MKKHEGKFHLECQGCGATIKGFKEWFDAMQKCPECGHKIAEVVYPGGMDKVKELIATNDKPESLWHYFDLLPLYEKENIISKNEGTIPVERWEFLETYAKDKFGLDITVNVYRNDQNPATGTFKDVAASVAASVLKENGIKQYAVASTGNIGSAYSHYLAEAGISLSAFIPQDALMENVAEIASYAQRIFRVKGDYAKAKKIAAEFSEKYKILLSGGNHDPMRVEAKKTMVFEWLRMLGDLPSVYIQALSGGTGPIAIDKAMKDIEGLGLFKTRPRYIMVQPDKCAPMAHGWADAKEKNFPEGFENVYPKYDNPQTFIPTLATGNPATYPSISRLVKKSNGEIIEFDEAETLNIARLIAYETNIRIGPAATIAVGGFFESLRQGHIKNNDRILINLGEGVRRASSFMQEMMYTIEHVDTIDDCTPPDRSKLGEQLWKAFDKYAEQK